MQQSIQPPKQSSLFSWANPPLRLPWKYLGEGTSPRICSEPVPHCSCFSRSYWGCWRPWCWSLPGAPGWLCYLAHGCCPCTVVSGEVNVGPCPLYFPQHCHTDCKDTSNSGWVGEMEKVDITARNLLGAEHGVQVPWSVILSAGNLWKLI